MKIDFLNFYLFSIPTNFDLAWQKILFSNHLIVELKYQNRRGIGEGVLYQTSPLKVLSLINGEIRYFFKQDFLSFSGIRKAFLNNFLSHPAVVCAFDTALWDLEGRVGNKPIHQLLKKKKKRSKVGVMEQIFYVKDRNNFEKKLRNILLRGTSSIKLKAGRNLNDDLENIRTIKTISKGKINIQLDLNQGLTFNRAIYFGRKIEKLGISAWEEPINFKYFKQLNRLKRKTKIPIVLDESVKSKKNLREAIKNRAIDILNIKINRLGGLTNSLDFADACEKYNIGINIGCNEELGIGTAAQLQLSSVLKNFKALEALGSNRLGFEIIKEDFVIRSGYLNIPIDKNGLGVNFQLFRLKKASKLLKFPTIHKDSISTNKHLFIYDYIIKRVKSKFFNGILFIKKKLT